MVSAGERCVRSVHCAGGRLAARKTASKLVSHKTTSAMRTRAATRTHLVHAKHAATPEDYGGMAGLVRVRVRVKR